MPDGKALREHVLNLLKGKEAHVDFETAIKDFPPALQGQRPEGAEHSAWELLEHLRIAQWDILEFSRRADHESPAWPQGYWPTTPAPPDDAAWDKSVEAFGKDLRGLCSLVEDESKDLLVPIPHGSGQTILREALLAADHNAYHIGQLVLLRRLLHAWHER